MAHDYWKARELFEAWELQATAANSPTYGLDALLSSLRAVGVTPEEARRVLSGWCKRRGKVVAHKSEFRMWVVALGFVFPISSITGRAISSSGRLKMEVVVRSNMEPVTSMTVLERLVDGDLAEAALEVLLTYGGWSN